MTDNYKSWKGRLISSGNYVAIDTDVRKHELGFPAPDDDEHGESVEWQLRYGDPSSVALQAASIIGAYGALIHASRVKREAVIRCIREALAQKGKE